VSCAGLGTLTAAKEGGFDVGERVSGHVMNTSSGQSCDEDDGEDKRQ